MESPIPVNKAHNAIKAQPEGLGGVSKQGCARARACARAALTSVVPAGLQDKQAADQLTHQSLSPPARSLSGVSAQDGEGACCP